MERRKEDFHYLVLQTRVLKQRQIANVLSVKLPPERGRIFIPEREYFSRKTKELATKPMFPGYIFALTDMTQAELHIFARKNHTDIQAFVKELSVRGSSLNKDELSGDSAFWSELTEEESDFIDTMLDDHGIERMSVGYRDGSRYVILEGPLKGQEKHITGSDRHNREAYLDISFRQYPVVVGLEQKPKSVFFPNGKQTTGVLEDGTEIYMEELSKTMMGNSIKVL